MSGLLFLWLHVTVTKELCHSYWREKMSFLTQSRGEWRTDTPLFRCERGPCWSGIPAPRSGGRKCEFEGYIWLYSPFLGCGEWSRECRVAPFIARRHTSRVKGRQWTHTLLLGCEQWTREGHCTSGEYETMLIPTL